MHKQYIQERIYMKKIGWLRNKFSFAMKYRYETF